MEALVGYTEEDYLTAKTRIERQLRGKRFSTYGDTEGVTAWYNYLSNLPEVNAALLSVGDLRYEARQAGFENTEEYVNVSRIFLKQIPPSKQPSQMMQQSASTSNFKDFLSAEKQKAEDKLNQLGIRERDTRVSKAETYDPPFNKFQEGFNPSGIQKGNVVFVRPDEQEQFKGTPDEPFTYSFTSKNVFDVVDEAQTVGAAYTGVYRVTPFIPFGSSVSFTEEKRAAYSKAFATEAVKEIGLFKSSPESFVGREGVETIKTSEGDYIQLTEKFFEPIASKAGRDIQKEYGFGDFTRRLGKGDPAAIKSVNIGILKGTTEMALFPANVYANFGIQAIDKENYSVFGSNRVSLPFKPFNMLDAAPVGYGENIGYYGVLGASITYGSSEAINQLKGLPFSQKAASVAYSLSPFRPSSPILTPKIDFIKTTKGGYQVAINDQITTKPLKALEIESSSGVIKGGLTVTPKFQLISGETIPATKVTIYKTARPLGIGFYQTEAPAINLLKGAEIGVIRTSGTFVYASVPTKLQSITTYDTGYRASLPTEEFKATYGRSSSARLSPLKVETKPLYNQGFLKAGEEKIINIDIKRMDTGAISKPYKSSSFVTEYNAGKLDTSGIFQPNIRGYYIKLPEISSGSGVKIMRGGGLNTGKYLYSGSPDKAISALGIGKTTTKTLGLGKSFSGGQGFSEALSSFTLPKINTASMFTPLVKTKQKSRSQIELKSIQAYKAQEKTMSPLMVSPIVSSGQMPNLAVGLIQPTKLQDPVATRTIPKRPIPGTPGISIETPFIEVTTPPFVPPPFLLPELPLFSSGRKGRVGAKRKYKRTVSLYAAEYGLTSPRISPLEETGLFLRPIISKTTKRRKKKR